MPLTIRRSLIDLVRQWRKIAYTICAGLTVLASGAVFVSISSPDATVPVSTNEPFFDSSRAFRGAEDMWSYLSSPGQTQKATTVFDWFEDQLPGPNMATQSSFDAPMGNETVSLTNFSVVLEGTTNEVILFVAPCDVPPVVRVEPLTYTSGMGIVLELIDVFVSQRHQKTIVFLLTEDSGNGGLGINHFLETSELADQVSVIVSIHGLGKVAAGTDRAHALSTGITSPRNTTPGWLLKLVSDSFAKSGVELSVPGLWRQAADRALALARGDQIAGLTKGIPSIRLYDDAPGNPNIQGLSAHGPSLERLVLSLDSGAQLPGDPGTALLLGSGRYLTNGGITLIAVLCLLPTIAALAIWFFAARVRFSTVLRHLRNLASFALPLAVTLLMAYFLTLGGLIPHYRFQVPTEGASAQSQIGPTLILLVVLIGSFIVSRRFLGYFRAKESKPVTEMAKLGTGFLSVLLGLILMSARSPFTMLVLLSVAWAWPFITCFTEPVYRGAFIKHRLPTNLPMLLIGLLTPLVFYGYVASRRGVGWWNTAWFFLVQAMSGEYGMLGPVAAIFLVAGFAVLVGVRRMRVVPIETLDVKNELSGLELPPPRFSRRSRRRPRDRSRPRLSPWG
jgi:hypothetical protein